jgi:GWxTD domain-containing protein
MSKNNRYVETIMVLIAMSFVIEGCASQSRMSVPYMENALSGSKFDFFIISYPYSNPDSSAADLYARIRYDNLIFVRTDSSYSAHYQLSISLYSEKGLPESRHTKIFDRQLTAAKYSQTLSVNMFDSLRDRIVAKPGKYFMTFRLLDLNTNVTSSKEIEYDLKDFFHDSVSISDVMVCDSSDTTPIKVIRNSRAFADFYITSKNVPTKISLHLIAKSTEAPTSIDTVYELNQISKVQYYQLPVAVSNLSAATYDLRVSVRNDFAETSFMIPRNKLLPALAELDRETGPLVYIMTSRQYDSLNNAPSQERVKKLKDFWLVRSQRDTTVAEAMEKEFYKRVEAADERFGMAPLPGWETDRGRIYILYGKPDRIENHSSSFRSGPAASVTPYEVWYYDSLKLRFVFVQDSKDGNYRLAKGST